MSRPGTPQKKDSSLLMRTRKSHQDFRVLAAESLANKDEPVYANDPSFQETHGLLSQVIEMGNVDDGYHNKLKEPPKWYKRVSMKYMVLLLCGLGLFLGLTKIVMHELEKTALIKNKLYYNGTDYFDSTVIYISLDGFRNDYLDRNVTPNIHLLAEQGIRAEYMNPSFPSITFPNHWTLVTGLYPEAHGIVANEFYDPDLGEQFIHKDPSISGDPKWWGGEPIWITSKNQGKKSAVIMWPGSNVPIQGVSPDYYLPYTRATTAIDKMDITLGWLDLPIQERPQSISIYIPQIDQKGHGGGPEGKQLNSVLSAMDDAVGHLMDGLAQRNLEKHVHLVVVSDHGMAQSDRSRLIFYDHILSAESQSFLREREAWPLLGLRPKDDAPDHAIDQIYNEILQYIEKQEGDCHFQVYKREEMPARFHYDATERIAPIVMIPDVGYIIIRSTEYNTVTGKYGPNGVHGYDNMALEMRAIFTARGPVIDRSYLHGTVVDPFFNTEMYQFLTTLLELDPAPNNSTLNGIFKVQENRLSY